MAVRIALVDDHALIRGGLRRALEAEDGLEVVGEADSVATALAMEEQLRPDVMLVDVNLAGGTEGLDLIAELRARRPELGLVVLTMYDDDKLLLRALSAGASAYTVKSSSTDQIVAALRHAVTAPRAFSAEGLARALSNATAPDEHPALTPREQEVLELLATGAPVASIARQMFLSVSTLKTHVSRVYEKLGSSSRTEAVLVGVKLGLVKLDRQP